MKLGIFSHSDDEVIWANTQEFDKIIIVYFGVKDKPEVKEKRIQAMLNHPLKSKMIYLFIEELDIKHRRDRCGEHNEQFNIIVDKLAEFIEGVDEVWTHNPWGEYGHADHILVSKAVMRMFNCPIFAAAFGKHGQNKGYTIHKKKFDFGFYYKVKNVYQEAGCWTGYAKYPHTMSGWLEYIKLK